MTTITYERVPQTVTRYDSFKMVPVRTVYDYNVLIDGEWRATFKNNATWHSAGFRLSDRTGKSLDHDARLIGQAIAKADFDKTVQMVLPKIATIAQIERHITMEAAEADNRKFDQEREAYKARIHREMLSEALSQYVENANHPEEQTDEERAKLAAAEAMLDKINAVIANA
jgi:hypothetical protein